MFPDSIRARSLAIDGFSATHNTRRTMAPAFAGRAYTRARFARGAEPALRGGVSQSLASRPRVSAGLLCSALCLAAGDWCMPIHAQARRRALPRQWRERERDTNSTKFVALSLGHLVAEEEEESV